MRGELPVVLEGLKNHSICTANYSQHELHPKPDDNKAADWVFVLDTLNFSFWNSGNDPKWKVNGYTGYFALCAAIKRAIEAGKPILDPNYYAKISKADLEAIFDGDEDSGKAPLVDERLKCLHEVGTILLEKYNGSFTECIKACRGSAVELLKLIVTEFQCFRDEADFHGHKVALYKRAQILIGDIWACFQEKDLGAFHDIEVITMFADYRIPQVLVHFGAMRYSNPLLSMLQTGTELKQESIEEVEIRGCSIEVVERVCDEVRSLIKRYPSLNLKESDCNAILIDNFLWDYRRRHAQELESIPFHRVRCIYY
ncbi:queuosine salvage protein isoform X2 [Cephus cinctus]|uniref:Queuosine 5'-phosphate N-glycosylase/hydrolase n=1 Tax=Cephus cinctus TaxID=211228 RepID=A0AAJ7REL8_CEPCN|nr:queuosine salvage protein isoform X2 [Cephus cinctus]